MEVETLESSVWTLARVWGDLARAAPKTAFEYLAAMAEAALRPKPGAADTERAVDVSSIVEGCRLVTKLVRAGLFRQLLCNVSKFQHRSDLMDRLVLT